MAMSQRAFTSSRTALGPVRVSRTASLSVFARESRIGARPITIPKGVTITLDGSTLKVKGPKGELVKTFLPAVKLEQEAGVLKVSKAEVSRLAMQQHGLTRTLASNMVVGVSEGFSKTLELVGTGYRAAVAGQELSLSVGYNKPRVLYIPPGVTVKVEKNTTILISGSDKCVIGDLCATIRRQRPPEPYKGKGIRYQGEVIKLKDGKAGGKKK